MPRSKVRVSSGVWKLFCSALSLMGRSLRLAMSWLSVRGSHCNGLAVRGWIAGCSRCRCGCSASSTSTASSRRNWAAARPAPLLRLLALARGHAVPADVLAAVLWGDAQPAKPADQVAVLVSRLRGVLGRDRLEHGDGGYRLRYDWLDADELAGLVEEIERRQRAGNLVGAAAASRVALSLVRGDVPAERLDGDWAAGQLADLDRLVSRVRRLAATALAAAGFWVEAADLSAAAVARDPYDEDALRLLMRANVSGGRVGSALAAYADARRRLADDLGTDPSPETEALHAAILRGEVAAAGRHIEAGARLVGRQSQLDRLDVIASRSHAGSLEIVVVAGEAGIGKTSLLRAWAARRAAIGEVVLSATCGPLDRAVPLDALMVAIGTHLHAAGGPHRRGTRRRRGVARAVAGRVDEWRLGSAATGRRRRRPGHAVRGAAARAAAPGGARTARDRPRRRAPGRAGAGRVAALRAPAQHRDGRVGGGAGRRGRGAAGDGDDRTRPAGPRRRYHAGGRGPRRRVVQPVRRPPAVAGRARPRAAPPSCPRRWSRSCPRAATSWATRRPPRCAPPP